MSPTILQSFSQIVFGENSRDFFARNRETGQGATRIVAEGNYLLSLFQLLSGVGRLRLMDYSSTLSVFGVGRKTRACRRARRNDERATREAHFFSARFLARGQGPGVKWASGVKSMAKNDRKTLNVRRRSKVKVKGQGQRSGSEVKVKGHGQRSKVNDLGQTSMT
jgi:hypothetical protein